MPCGTGRAAPVVDDELGIVEKRAAGIGQHTVHSVSMSVLGPADALPAVVGPARFPAAFAVR
ncbi:hypothetical protein FB471_0091 [Amycolatopsis cihanbeyliensis]|uniref:Uncharacterized protein n=1 Tax=Amycolatopsis cihanbeyliensis TaxID=1128664 RepID=A0A542DBM8_AMYCI|nr:hypothetical protein FB471_0091 [Amycolatopsis cihanbeyliensis]